MVIVCVVGLDTAQYMMVTDDGEVSAIRRVTQLVWCQHNSHALRHSNGVLVLWCGKHNGHVVNGSLLIKSDMSRRGALAAS